MDREDIIDRLQLELKAADAAQELYTNDIMSEDDKLEFKYYQGKMDILQLLLVELISGTIGI